MENLTVSFYNLENIELYNHVSILDLSLHTWVALVAGAVIFLLLKIFFLYATGAVMVFRENREEAKKQDIMHDLILMKDVQTELDKEIEEATLRATFQS
jgi:hypothetical protein